MNEASDLVSPTQSFEAANEFQLKVSFMRTQFNLAESGVTDEERRLILEEHNYLRQTVATGHVPGQPAAQNMQEMQWDDELAAKAQQWANECTFQHDPSRYLGEFTQAIHPPLRPHEESIRMEKSGRGAFDSFPDLLGPFGALLSVIRLKLNIFIVTYSPPPLSLTAFVGAN
jgi:Cysteine-rich secretory protein family